MLPNSLLSWVDSYAQPIPLKARTNSRDEQTISKLLEQHPILVGTDVEALLWIRLGLIDRAHDIVQEASRGTPAYIHGMIHRLEGDYWNANYWFGRVRGSEVLQSVEDEVKDEQSKTRFSPTAFTAQVESLSESGALTDLEKNQSSQAANLASVALQEWTAVWKLVGRTFG